MNKNGLYVVDELMTPGCPQCAIKHLSAALYHKAQLAGWAPVPCPDPYMVCVCIAYINLVEVRAGYLSHLWYAVGALVRAEEHMAVRVGPCVARETRLLIEESGVEGVMDALIHIRENTAPTHADWAAAHFAEATRELPAYAPMMQMDRLIENIEEIREEYFELPPSTVPGEETQQGKEPDMATAKKTGACKGAKCCDKGGKAKRACNKGGKAKK